ncbi:multidrug efflux RND transporter periplasmic adaptor subunit VexE [Vibrio cholerae]|uniref:multidrug efflux RND transporter periplasmic adaptor subunit VexE n=1 Tax=Vibrio cholerae TaxID=666 RepID=UPI00165E3117|nr:multidrug efflux RND transporter periplasmic adaptor subunit VexE [Vibrio cholerae]
MFPLKTSSRQARDYFLHQPWLISFAFIILLALWLGLGDSNAEEPQTATEIQVPLAKVGYQTFSATQTDKVIELYGRTAPDRQAKIGAEIAGRIAEVKIAKGQMVTKNQIIALIDKGDLDAQLERAKAQLKVRQQEFNAASALKNKGLQGEVAFTNAAAALTDAQSSLSTVQRLLDNTQVRAPFDGVVETLPIEKGDFVGIGDPVASIIDLHKLVIEADVSERHIQHVQLEQAARIRFIDGTQTQGKVRYISRLSSPATNTFAIEVEVDNPQQAIPAGVSAEVELSLMSQAAIKITPAMLALDEEGNLGVKTLQGEHAKFVPIQLVKAEQDGVWLTGLGEQVDIITRGQGFVRDGDKVLATQLSATH